MALVFLFVVCAPLHWPKPKTKSAAVSTLVASESLDFLENPGLEIRDAPMQPLQYGAVQFRNENSFRAQVGPVFGQPIAKENVRENGDIS